MLLATFYCRRFGALMFASGSSGGACLGGMHVIYLVITILAALGTAAAIGLVLYFVCAVTAHLRVRDRQIGGAVFFLLLAAAALTASVAYHG
jgi:hypothetical protein